MTLASILRPLAATFLMLCWLPSPSAAQPARPDAFYVFGDSLADTGNVWLSTQALGLNPAPPPSESPHLTYYQGRFSNGPVAMEYLWQLLSGHAPGTPGALRPSVSCVVVECATAINFAYGGTGTPEVDLTPGGFPAPGLKGQIEIFARTVPKVSRRALFAVVTGANDYRDDPFNVPMDPTEVVAAIGDGVTRLYQLGARRVIVLTLPDLGKLPYLTAAQARAGSTVAAAHNALLAQRVRQLSSTLPGLDLRLVDTNVVFTILRVAVSAQPAPPGLPFPLWALPALDVLLPPFSLPGSEEPTPMSACLFVSPASCQDVPARFVKRDGTLGTPFPLLFWDIVHPTTHAHQALALYAYAQLAR